MTEIVIGTIQKILEIAGTLLFVNAGDPEPSPTAPYTFVLMIFSVGGKDYYTQNLIKDGPFTPV